MVKTLVTDFFIYRWRYWIGYMSVAVILIGLLVFASLYVPGGISQDEIRTTVKTSTIDMQNIETLAVSSLPYSLLQRASFELFGVSNFTIKLPSIVFAFVASIGAVLLLRRWFRPNIAVLATIIMITTGQFVFVAQSGTPGITYITWSVWLLLAATMITTDAPRRQFWLYALAIIAALSLYTPLSIYLIGAMLFAALLHPHVRHTIKHIPTKQRIISGIIFGIVAAPLVVGIIANPNLGVQLLGLHKGIPTDLLANAQQLAQQYLNFMSPASGTLMTPVFGLGSFVLILIGIWRLFVTRYTARNYTIVAWTLMLLPVLIFNPSYTSVTFVPILLLLATGLEYLLDYWYKMFPRNPYARIAGLMPLVILVGGLVYSGVERYMYGYRHDPQTASAFTKDLNILNDHLEDQPATTLLVTKSEQPFYHAVASYGDAKDELTVVIHQPANGSFIATREAHKAVARRDVKQIFVDSHANDSDRFYTYK